MSLALALSGGGHRAAAFHLGVLKYLASKYLLEDISVVSSTSGGSILTAQLFHHSRQSICSTASSKNTEETLLSWPTSDAFLSTVLGQAEERIINQSLENHFIRRMINPKNWLKFGHRANLMAEVIHDYWSITSKMESLPQKPDWIINGTTNITGSRWYVKQSEGVCLMGSEDIGSANAKGYSIADAVALSAAYPGVIGPYRLSSKNYQWQFSVDSKSNQHLMQSQKGLYLSDGGLYDNLGLEPLFNIETSSLVYPKTDFLIVSDAGSSIKRQRLAPVWRPILRTLRLINVISQQVRVLRLRSLLSFFHSNPSKGLYIPIGMTFSQWSADRVREGQPVPEELMKHEFLSEKDVLKAKNTATSLASLSTQQCQLLVRHGFESAMIQFSVAEL